MPMKRQGKYTGLALGRRRLAKGFAWLQKDRATGEVARRCTWVPRTWITDRPRGGFTWLIVDGPIYLATPDHEEEWTRIYKPAIRFPTAYEAEFKDWVKGKLNEARRLNDYVKSSSFNPKVELDHELGFRAMPSSLLSEANVDLSLYEERELTSSLSRIGTSLDDEDKLFRGRASLIQENQLYALERRPQDAIYLLWMPEGYKDTANSQERWHLQETVMDRIGIRVAIPMEWMAYCWVEHVRCFYPARLAVAFGQWCLAKKQEKVMLIRQRERNLAYESPLVSGQRLPIPHVDADMVFDQTSRAWFLKNMQGYSDGAAALPDRYAPEYCETEFAQDFSSYNTVDPNRTASASTPHTFAVMQYPAYWPHGNEDSSDRPLSTFEPIASHPPASNQSSAQPSATSSLLLAGGLMIVNGGPTKQ